MSDKSRRSAIRAFLEGPTAVCAIWVAGCGEGPLPPPGPPPPEPPPAPVVVRNVHVLSMASAEIVPDQAVVSEDGRIRWIGDDADVAIPAGARIVDGSERYVLPGLADMHVHTSLEEEFLLYVANGVTTVRDMAGSPDRLDFRDRIEREELVGPRYLVSSPHIDGPNPGGLQGSVVIDSPEEAATLVAEQIARGYDFLKVYSSLALPVYEALIRAADARGFEVVGHIPTGVPLTTALTLNHRSHEHLFGYVDAVESPDSPDLGEFTFRRIYGGLDIEEGDVPALAASVAAAGVWNCPTLLNHDKWVPADLSAELLAREVNRYAHPDRRAAWDPANSPIQNLPEILADWTPERFALGRTNLGLITEALHDAGAGIILGTDAGSTHIIHGFAVHDELDRMVEAGLSNFEALRTATYAVGEYLGRPGDIGALVVGAEADLVLAEENPLVSLATLRRPSGVMVRGRWFDRAVLDGMLAAVEEAFRWSEP